MASNPSVMIDHACQEFPRRTALQRIAVIRAVEPDAHHADESIQGVRFTNRLGRETTKPSRKHIERHLAIPNGCIESPGPNDGVPLPGDRMIETSFEIQ